MFDIHCNGCGKHQLLSISRIRQLVNHEQGIEVIFECWCGTQGAYWTGKNARPGDSMTIDSEKEHDRLPRLPSRPARR